MSETILWGDLLSAHGNARSAETTAADARQHRDQLVADLVAAGVSMYRVAKVLGVSESGVRKIVDRGRAGVARRDAGGGSGAMSKGTGESMPVEPSAELVEQGTP